MLEIVTFILHEIFLTTFSKVVKLFQYILFICELLWSLRLLCMRFIFLTLFWLIFRVFLHWWYFPLSLIIRWIFFTKIKKRISFNIDLFFEVVFFILFEQITFLSWFIFFLRNILSLIFWPHNTLSYIILFILFDKAFFRN